MPGAEFARQYKSCIFIMFIEEPSTPSKGDRNAGVFYPEDFPKSANQTHFPLTAEEAFERMSF